MNQDKKELIEQIKQLISSNDTPVQINPNYLELFSYDELISTLESLKQSKSQAREDTNQWFDELFGKIK
jgi:hypothetical protein